MIGGAVEVDARFEQAAEGVGERGTAGIEDGGVIEAGRARRGRVPAGAFPGVQAKVVVIAAGGDESGLDAMALHELETEDTAVKGEGAVEVGDFQVDVTDADTGMDGRSHEVKIGESPDLANQAGGLTGGGGRAALAEMSYKEDRSVWFEGQGLWQHVPEADWQDWAWQLKNRITKLEELERYMTLTADERAGVLFASQKLALAITPYFFNLIDRDDPNCPIRLQMIPRSGETQLHAEEMLDSLGEDEHSPVPGLVHRYPDRVLFLVTDRCAAYCRYCTRSRLVSNAQDYNFHPEYEQGLRYIESHPEVRDVLLSGGDPLLLSDRKLDHLLGRLRAIPHVEFIRIGSRIPVFLPQRITPGLCEILKKHGPVWMSIHVNHPREATAELKAACERLSFAGVPLGNQSVLLRGVNDDAEVMKALVHRLLRMRVRPYYLYQMDLITGGSHFKVDVRKGLEIVQALRGHTTGYSVPQYVIDAPGGGGKVPMNPEYVEKITDDEVVFRNYEGRIFRYPLTATPVTRETEDGRSFAPERLSVAQDFQG